MDEKKEFFFVPLTPLRRLIGRMQGPFTSRGALIEAITKHASGTIREYLVFEGAFLLKFDPNELPIPTPAKQKSRLRLVEKIQTETDV